jgi:choline dehydrogenase-like flavoprotein
MAELVDSLAGAGMKPFPMPLGIQLDERQPQQGKCIRCNTCDGYPCLVGGKADAHVIAVAPALAHGNVTLVTGALVKRLETDAAGRSVRQVVVDRDGKTETYRGDVVVVSAGAINSAAILLRSASDKHPHGLANGSGMVGRNYMSHINSIFFAVTTRRNDTVFQKTLGVNDFYFRGDDWDHPMGHISMVGKSDGNFLKAGAPLAPVALLKRVAKHAFDFWLTSEDLPDRDNRITLERDGQIRVSYTPNNLEGHARLTRRLKRIVKQLLPLGITISARMPVAATAHQCGTVRFGDDPATSVLDRNCKAHELDNLYVVDASFFPSSAAVNPALTIMANALRVADHLKARLAA